jgi:molecular chaperone GrpE (heat shock protein)
MSFVTFSREFGELFSERIAARITSRWFLTTFAKYMVATIASASLFFLISAWMAYPEVAQILVNIIFLLVCGAIYFQSRAARRFSDGDYEFINAQVGRRSHMWRNESRLYKLRSDINDDLHNALKNELRSELSYDYDRLIDQLRVELRREIRDRVEREELQYSSSFGSNFPLKAFFETMDYFALHIPNSDERERIVSGLRQYLKRLGFVGIATVGEIVETKTGYRVVFEIPSSQPRGTILHVVAQGYRYIGTGQVIRDAYVVISGGSHE